MHIHFRCVCSVSVQIGIYGLWPWKLGSKSFYRDCLSFQFFFSLYGDFLDSFFRISWITQCANHTIALFICFFTSTSSDWFLSSYGRYMNQNDVNRLRGEFNCCKFTHFSEKGNRPFLPCMKGNSLMRNSKTHFVRWFRF